MLSVCLSDFPFAIDGGKVEQFKTGDKRDFSQHTESLTKKGYLAPAEPLPEAKYEVVSTIVPTQRLGKRSK